MPPKGKTTKSKKGVDKVEEEKNDTVSDSVNEGANDTVNETPKISLDAFISMKKHSWPVKARLEHAVTVYKLSHENTVKEWEEILKKFA